MDLVSNLGQASTGSTGYLSERAQRFTTGAHPGGYVLDHIEFQRWSSFSPEVSVCRTDMDGFPGSSCTKLTPRTVGFYDETVTYDAPNNTTLNSSTLYTVFVKNQIHRSIPWTTSDAEDATSARGWRLANEWDYVERATNPDSGELEATWKTGTDGRSLRLAIRGRRRTPTPCPAPSLSGRTEIWRNDVVIGATVLGSAYGYSSTELGEDLPNAGVFGGLSTPAATTFQDAQESTYTVGSVKVLSGSGSLQVYLSEKVTESEAPNIWFHACDATFKFGEADDETDYTSWYRYTWYNSGLNWTRDISRAVRVSHRQTNVAATGKPSISGRALVGETLTAGIAGVADENGLPETFTYQWVRVDGEHQTDILDATQDTYTLLGADHRKEIRVKVSFVDHADYDESLTSDTFPSGGLVGGVPPASARADPNSPETAIGVTWSAVEQVGTAVIDGYRIDVRSEGAGWATLVADTGNATDLTYTHSGLPPGSQRYYRVHPLAGTEDFGYGSEAGGRTHPNPPGIPQVTVTRLRDFKWAPEAPNGPHSAVLLGYFELRWAEVDDGAPDYAANVSYCISGWPLGYSEIAQLSTSGDGATNYARVYVDPAAIDGLRVRAYNYAHRPGADNELCTESSIRVSELRNAPRVRSPPQVGGAGSDNAWTEGERVAVTLAFSEAVTVDTSGGTPSLRISLGAGKERSVRYLRGSGSEEVVFAYELGAWDGEHSSVRVRAGSLVLNGGTIRSRTNGADASLDHDGAVADVSARESRSSGPTAWFEALPDHHDGSTPVTLELHFSEEPQGLSYRTVGGALLEVTGASITGARRLTPHDNSGWELTVQPRRNDDIVIRLPNRACTEANAICVNGQPLAAAAEATIAHEGREEIANEPLPPFTAAFAADAPEEHDGSAVELAFHLSHAPQSSFSYKTVRDALFTVTGGRLERAWRRVTSGDEKNMHWNLRVAPFGDGDATLTLKPTTDCATLPGVCRQADGAMLAEPLSLRIKGPARLSVADATVQEAPGATLDFVVTLSRARSETTTVEYATSDGTATSGDDYTAASGTLTFTAQQTSRTVSVAVLNDAHDEGNETLTLTLANPAGATLDDGAATGTIQNTDPMPKAWLARFGRAAADHTLDAIAQRLQTARPGAHPDSHLTLAGRRADSFLDPCLRFLPGAADPADRDPGCGGSPDRGSASGGAASGSPRLYGARTSASPGAGPSGGLGSGGLGPGGLDPGGASAGTPFDGTGRSPVGLGAGSSNRGGPGRGWQLPRLPGLHDLALGSSFFLAARQGAGDGAPEGPGRLGEWAAWGNAAATDFGGADGPLGLEGEVFTATLGLDGTWNRWLTGVALSRSEGDGAYTHPEGLGGSVSSTLTSLSPFARLQLNERASVWAAAGYGLGELALAPDAADAVHETGLANRMVALGGRAQVAARASPASGFRLEVVSDLRLTNTTSEEASNLANVAARTGRGRVMLQGSGTLRAAGATLQPTLEGGLRYDAGDAETGTGVEVGAGLGYAAGRLLGLVKLRALVAHEDAEYEEWGLSGQLTYTPNAKGRGLTMSLGSAMGATQGGVQALWSRHAAAGLARGGAPMPAGQSFQGELGYITDGLRGRALWTPFVAAEAAGHGPRALRIGVKVTSGPNLEARLEARQRTAAGAEPRHVLELGAQIRF